MREKGLLFVFSLSTLNDRTINDFLFSFFCLKTKTSPLSRYHPRRAHLYFLYIPEAIHFPTFPRMCRINVLIFYGRTWVSFKMLGSTTYYTSNKSASKMDYQKLRRGRGIRSHFGGRDGWDRRREKVGPDFLHPPLSYIQFSLGKTDL